ncbi:MAG TPA: MarR family transcriptional regulator [Thermoanaerobaculia bacterium]|nr:MarR family transcriptional regulator [Thermoanaerobaculia bacterium]
MVSRIQQEIKQSRPFQTTAEEAAIALMRTADLVRRAVASIVEPHGITPQQYNVLRILRGAGEKGLPTLEVAERMVEQTPGITRLIDRLERKRLVLRERCPTDRRQVFCRITKEGLALLAKLDGPVSEAGQWAPSLSAHEHAQLMRLLDKARKSLSAGVIAVRSETQINNRRRIE